MTDLDKQTAKEIAEPGGQWRTYSTGPYYATPSEIAKTAAFAARQEAETAFWCGRTIPTFDIEETSYGYMGSYRDMVAQTVCPEGYVHGDWIRADDYRAEISALERKAADQHADNLSMAGKLLEAEALSKKYARLLCIWRSRAFDFRMESAEIWDETHAALGDKKHD